MRTLQKREKALVESLSKGPVLSAENPGEWAGKEDKHIPVATAVDNGVQIDVKHVMDGPDDGKDLHYIEFIWVRPAPPRGPRTQQHPCRMLPAGPSAAAPPTARRARRC